MPQSAGTLDRTAAESTPNSGYAAMTAEAWPGISISGTIVMLRSAA